MAAPDADDGFRLSWKDIADLNGMEVFDPTNYLPCRWGVVRDESGALAIDWDHFRNKLSDNHPARSSTTELSRDLKLHLLDEACQEMRKARKFLKKLFRNLEGHPVLDDLWDKFPENIDAYDDAIMKARKRLGRVMYAYHNAYQTLL